MARVLGQFEFYNAGDARSERFAFNNVASGNPHAISYWVMEAPKAAFFKVPREMPAPFGSGTVSVNFADDILERFGHLGVVIIDPATEAAEELPYAKDREEAKRKGDATWKMYCRKKIQEFNDENDTRVSLGQAKLRPSGFVVHAHKELGLAVPEEAKFMEAATSKSDVEELREQVAKLTALVGEKVGAKK